MPAPQEGQVAGTSRAMAVSLPVAVPVRNCPHPSARRSVVPGELAEVLVPLLEEGVAALLGIVVESIAVRVGDVARRHLGLPDGAPPRSSRDTRRPRSGADGGPCPSEDR